MSNTNSSSQIIGIGAVYLENDNSPATVYDYSSRPNEVETTCYYNVGSECINYRNISFSRKKDYSFYRKANKAMGGT